MSSTTRHEPQRTTTPLALAATIAGGTLAYADPVRFDNDGTFVWSAGVYLDLTKPAEEQSGHPTDTAVFQYDRTPSGFPAQDNFRVLGSGPQANVVRHNAYAIAIVGAPGELVPDDFIHSRSLWSIDAFLGIYYMGGSGFDTYFDKANAGTLADPGYLAARFNIDGATHYGWIALRLYRFIGGPPSNEFELLAWGYETEPNTPIEAGAVPAPSAAMALLAFGAAAGATRARRN